MPSNLEVRGRLGKDAFKVAGFVILQFRVIIIVVMSVVVVNVYLVGTSRTNVVEEDLQSRSDGLHRILDSILLVKVSILRDVLPQPAQHL